MVNVVIRTGLVFMLILKLKLFQRHFIGKSEVLLPNELNGLIMCYTWVFILCVLDIAKQHLFHSKTISTFLNTFCSHSVSNSKASATVLTAVSSAGVTLNLVIIMLIQICLQYTISNKNLNRITFKFSNWLLSCIMIWAYCGEALRD